MTGVDVSGRVIVLDDLQADLDAAGVAVPHGLTIAGPTSGSPVFPPPPFGAPPAPCVPGSMLFTYDANGEPADLPDEALPVLESYAA